LYRGAGLNAIPREKRGDLSEGSSKEGEKRRGGGKLRRGVAVGGRKHKKEVGKGGRYL